MKIKFWLNHVEIEDEINPDTPLLEYLRGKNCYSVKRGCETANCGLCTVLVEDRPVLSCGTLAVRVDGRHVVTMEGLQEKAKEFGEFLADEGAEQCGFCSPGFIMNVLAMEKELRNPTEEEIKEYLAGNLCRCTGYMGQLRAIRLFLEHKQNLIRGGEAS